MASAYPILLADAPATAGSVGYVNLDAALAGQRPPRRWEIGLQWSSTSVLLAKAGVEAGGAAGVASNRRPVPIAVTAADGSSRQLRGERILVAVGGRPHRPGHPRA